MHAVLAPEDMTEEQAKEAFSRIMAELATDREKMRADDAEFARIKKDIAELKAESAVVAAEIRATLARLEAVK